MRLFFRKGMMRMEIARRHKEQPDESGNPTRF
jgi:hypothetical protein